MSDLDPAPADVQAAFCAVLVDEWARAGVTDAVVAPGSRSTPLVVALDREPRIRVQVVLDERSAGYVALGVGLVTGRPAVVATTSGTASVELHPAIVEASYAGVPLIAATADRPPELHHVGAPQTVEQEGLYGSAPRWSVAPGVADLASATSWRSVASRSVAEASGRSGSGGPGPVHVNLAFREPLLGDGAAVAVPAGRPDGAPWHRLRSVSGGPATDEEIDLLVSHAGGRGLVVAGAGAGASAAPGESAAAGESVAAGESAAAGDAGRLLDVAARLGWPVLADPRSGCRAEGAVGAADALLRVPAVARWTPDVVLRLGAPWASKVLNQWLAGLGSDVPQILVDPWGRWADPDRAASHVVSIAPSRLVATLDRRLPAVDNSNAKTAWMCQWLDAERSAQLSFGEHLDTGGPLEMSEPAVARAVLGGLPPRAQVVVSSSMPVRDVEWYGLPAPGVTVLSNRGANGIDGVLSTAVGAALGTGAPTVALLGDLAFVYDAGALLWAADREISLTVVVVDNDGGGIFSFLPQASELDAASFERYWGTPHGLDLGALASAYGAEVTEVSDRIGLDGLVASAAKPGVRVGLVRSDRAANVDAHDRLHAAVAARLTLG